MLNAQRDGQRVDARKAERGAPHICPGCEDPVVLHRGAIIAAHFKHKAEATCDYARGETIAHLDAKDLVRAEFERRGSRVETEFVVDTMPGDRRADVMVWSPRGNMFAFELQHTAVDPRNIAERVAAYARVGIRQCWIPFIPDEVWNKGQAIKDTWSWPGYTPRAYEVWLHRMHAGQGVWMYDRRDGKFWLATLKPHTQFVEYRVYYDESGEERSSGGYPYTARKKMDLTLAGPYPLSSLNVKAVEVRGGNWKKIWWPPKLALVRLAAATNLDEASI